MEVLKVHLPGENFTGISALNGKRIILKKIDAPFIVHFSLN